MRKMPHENKDKLDILIDQVARAEYRKLMEEDMSDLPDCEPSPELDARMYELFGTDKTPAPINLQKQRCGVGYKVGGWVAACLVVALVGIPFAAQADWSGIGQFFTKGFSKYSVGSSVEIDLLAVAPEVNNDIAKQYPGIYVLTLLPEGYELSEKKGLDHGSITLTYSNGVDSISFIQQRKTDLTGKDIEAKGEKTFTQDGVEYEYGDKEEFGQDYKHLRWSNSFYEFDVVGPYNREILLKLAAGINKI